MEALSLTLLPLHHPLASLHHDWTVLGIRRLDGLKQPTHRLPQCSFARQHFLRIGSQAECLLEIPQQESNGPTGNASRSKPKTRTTFVTDTEEKSSRNSPQPDEFDDSQAPNEGDKARASPGQNIQPIQASFKSAVTRAFKSLVSAVKAPFRWLALLCSLLLALGWIMVENLPGLVQCGQMILGLRISSFGKGTFIEAKN